MSKFGHVGLPPIETFYSTLRQEGITEEEYKHAQRVYDELGCKSFYDYHMGYLKTDVFLLADVFEKFRKTRLSYYNLDPANDLTAPSLAWGAMLLQTGVHLDLITDLEMPKIFESAKRGGLCFVGSKRHVKANNKYLDDYSPKEDSNS